MSYSACCLEKTHDLFESGHFDVFNRNAFPFAGATHAALLSAKGLLAADVIKQPSPAVTVVVNAFTVCFAALSIKKNDTLDSLSVTSPRVNHFPILFHCQTST